MAERNDDDTSNWNLKWDPTGGVKVNLPKAVRGDLGTLRRLHHRMVDITADAGFVATLADEAERCLGSLTSGMAAQYMIDLLAEAHAPARKSKQAKKSKKIGKRGLKRV